MSSLLDAKLLDLGTPEQLATHVLGRPIDMEKEGYDLIPEALDYLARYPLNDDLLDSVERMEFDGGKEASRFARNPAAGTIVEKLKQRGVPESIAALSSFPLTARHPQLLARVHRAAVRGISNTTRGAGIQTH